MMGCADAPGTSCLLPAALNASAAFQAECNAEHLCAC